MFSSLQHVDIYKNIMSQAHVQQYIDVLMSVWPYKTQKWKLSKSSSLNVDECHEIISDSPGNSSLSGLSRCLKLFRLGKYTNMYDHSN